MAAPSRARALRVVFLVDAWQPFNNAGGETTAAELAADLHRRGHSITAIVRALPREATNYQWRGVAIRRRGSARWTDRLIRELEADVIITQLVTTQIGIETGQRLGLPVVHLLHNDSTLERFGVTHGDLLVANAEWVRASIPARARHIPAITVYPPTLGVSDLPDHDNRRRYVTIVNASEIKGGHIFAELAAARPRLPFLTVTGGYGLHTHPAPLSPNHRTVLNRPDMSPIWARTRILAVPSRYESFGKAAGEAMAHGIPVIAHPTEGLLENLGDAGLFIDRADRAGWLEAIGNLYHYPNLYASASRAARARALELEAIIRAQLDTFEAELLNITQRAAA